MSNTKDTITITWHIDDVLRQAYLLDIKLTKKNARDILSLAEKHFSPEITWDRLSELIQTTKLNKSEVK